MSLFLDVSIQAQSIVEAAWARATANRERLRRRLDVQAVREEAAVNRINGRSAGPGWELRYTTPTPLQYRPDEPVAYPVRRQQPVAVAPMMCFWQRNENVAGSTTFTRRVSLAPGNGQSPILTPCQLVDFPILPNNGISFFLGPGGVGVFRRIESSILASDYFPTGLDDLVLWVGVAVTFVQIDEVVGFVDGAIYEPISFTSTIVNSAAYTISVADITAVTPPAGLLDSIVYQYRAQPASNGYDMPNTKETSYSGPSPGGLFDGIGSLRTPSVFATFDGIAAGIFVDGVSQDSSRASLAAIIGAYPGNIPNQHAGESFTQPRLQTVPGIAAPDDPNFAAFFTTHLNQRDFCQAKSGYPS